MSDFDIYFPHPHGGKMPAVWRDKHDIMHRAVGAYVQRDIRLMWTACQKHDIPADSAWLKRPEDQITCPGCLQAYDRTRSVLE